MSSTGHAQAVRRVLASASLGAAAVGVGSVAHGDKGALGAAALVGVAAMGLARRSVLSQVLSRGVAWLVLTPSLLGLADSLGHGRLPDAYTVFFATTSAGALLLARPTLHADAAKAEFSPVGYRRVFLAGAVASVMTGAVLALYASEQLAWGQLGRGLPLALLGAALVASAVGVVRMRAWGVLLGMVTSVLLLGAAVLSSNPFVAIGLALAAIPGAVLASPLLAARLRRPAPAARASAGRLATGVPLEEDPEMAPPVFARIGVPAEAEGQEPAQPRTGARVAVGERR